MWMDLHSALSMVAPDAGRPTFNMDMWLDFLERVGLRTSETTIAECVKAFVVARMRWVDDTTFKYNLCDFVSFLEAIGHVLDYTPVPTKAALKQVGVAEVSEFYERIVNLKLEAKSADDRERIHELMDEDPDQPLSDKLELMLPYLLQNLAISTGGVFRTKAKQIDVSKFLSKEQAAKWTALAQIARPDLPEIGRARKPVDKLKAAAKAAMSARALAAFGA